MSADDWEVCPRCLDRAAAAAQARLDEARAAYGRVSAEEYLRLREQHAAEAEVKLEQTFREDYEFYGAEDGVITVVYSGECTVCRLSVSFKHEHPFYPTPPTD